MNRTHLIAFSLLILAAALLRLLPHAPNFTPIMALALLGGASFADRRLACAVPLAAMFLSDLVLGLHDLVPVVYATLLLVVAMGTRLGRGRTSGRLVLTTLAASSLFFVVTNLAVWARGELYPLTMEGLAEAYVAAIPFFQNQVLGDLFYVALLFGGAALVGRWLGRPGLSPGTA